MRLYKLPILIVYALLLCLTAFVMHSIGDTGYKMGCFTSMAIITVTIIALCYERDKILKQQESERDETKRI